MWNVLRLMPVSRICSVPVCSESLAGSYLMRTIRLSDGDVCMMYSQWSAANVGEISRPVRPPSPLVLCTFGTVPIECLAPVFGFRCTMSCASRSLNRMVPSGRVTRPHTTSSSVPTWVAAQTSCAGVQFEPGGVVTVRTGVLMPLSLRFRSDAVTWMLYVVFGLNPSSRVLVVLPSVVPRTFLAPPVVS